MMRAMLMMAAALMMVGTTDAFRAVRRGPVQRGNALKMAVLEIGDADKFDKAIAVRCGGPARAARQRRRAADPSALRHPCANDAAPPALGFPPQAAGDAVVVIDYSTTWCGPCKVRPRMRGPGERGRAATTCVSD